MDMPEDATDVVGAETGGQRGEMLVGRTVGEDRVELATVAEQHANDAEKGSDARRDGAVLSVVLGGGRRLLHEALLTMFVRFVKRRDWKPNPVLMRLPC